MSQALTAQATRELKSWIIHQSNGTWRRTIRSLLETGNICSFFIFDFFIAFSISLYATTSTEESVYVIGGWTSDSSTDDRTPVIAEYKNDQWYNVGQLKQSRYNSAAITFRSLTMVIGGSQGRGLG